MSKLLPRKYGDRIDITSDGECLAAPRHQIDACVQSIVIQTAERICTREAQFCLAEALELLDRVALTLKFAGVTSTGIRVFGRHRFDYSFSARACR